MNCHCVEPLKQVVQVEILNVVLVVCYLPFESVVYHLMLEAANHAIIKSNTITHFLKLDISKKKRKIKLLQSFKSSAFATHSQKAHN